MEFDSLYSGGDIEYGDVGYVKISKIFLDKISALYTLYAFAKPLP